MRKLLGMAVVVGMLATFTAVPASAGPCTGSTVLTDSGLTNCDITLSVTVLTAHSFTFSAVNTSFGSTAPGVTVDPAGGEVVGSLSSNGGTATLAITCIDGKPATFTGTSHFAAVLSGVAGTKNLTSTTPATCTSTDLASTNRTQVGAGSTGVMDNYSVVLDAAQGPGSYTQRLTYTVS